MDGHRMDNIMRGRLETGGERVETAEPRARAEGHGPRAAEQSSCGGLWSVEDTAGVASTESYGVKF